MFACYLRRLILAVLALPLPAIACSFAVGHAPKPASEAEWLSQADIVFTGQLLRRQISDDGNTLFIFGVDAWIKGGPGSTAEVEDGRARPCDSAYGIEHLTSARDPFAVPWLIHARQAEPGFRLLTAHRHVSSASAPSN